MCKAFTFSLFNLFQNDWIPGYALALGFFSEMIFYCVLGSKISVEVRVSNEGKNTVDGI